MAAPTTGLFTLVQQTPDLKIYQWRSMVVNFHWHEYRADQMKVIADVSAKVVREHGQMSSIVFMRGNINLAIDAETRRAAAALTKEFEPYNTGQALVIEADGFKASLARSIITGVNILARSTARQRVFRDAHEGFEWVCALDGQPDFVRETKQDTWREVHDLLSYEPA